MRTHGIESVAVLAPPASPEQPFVEGSGDEIDADLRHRLISEAAYALYQQRGYADGYELEDWLAAEQSVDHTLLHRPFDASASRAV